MVMRETSALTSATIENFVKYLEFHNTIRLRYAGKKSEILWHVTLFFLLYVPTYIRKNIFKETPCHTHV